MSIPERYLAAEEMAQEVCWALTSEAPSVEIWGRIQRAATRYSAVRYPAETPIPAPEAAK